MLPVMTNCDNEPESVIGVVVVKGCRVIVPVPRLRLAAIIMLSAVSESCPFGKLSVLAAGM